MLKLGIILLVLVVTGLVAGPPAFREFSVWDAGDPMDDGSTINKILFPLTPSVSPSQIQEAIGLKTGIVIDVRTEKEHDEASVPGSILIPEQDLATEIEKRFPKKDTLIYVYDNTGNNGAVSTRLLRSLGYERSYFMEGGIEAWKNDSYEIKSLYSFPQ